MSSYDDLSLSESLALGLYYNATLPYRAWSRRRRSRAGRAPVAIVFYHRVADTTANPWTASNRTFARQIAWLKRHFDLVSLAEAQRRLASGQNERAAVSITFDDGYADNCQQALPLLIHEQIPCTYFVSTRYVLEQKAFPHDADRGQPLAPNTPEQIRALADAGIEIGCHTRNHANMGVVRDRAELHEELVVSRAELERLTHRPVRYFAFPYGQPMHMTSEAFMLAREVGYAAVCSAYGGFNFPGDDTFHLQRIHADNDLLRLKNWLTVDPRKLRSTPRFYPAPVPSPALETESEAASLSALASEAVDLSALATEAANVTVATGVVK
jgi:peptidoglycan/xylan/chitin deacetylase (PgdA/CDA1 family)